LILDDGQWKVTEKGLRNKQSKPKRLTFLFSRCSGVTREASAEQFSPLNLHQVAIILIITSLHFALMQNEAKNQEGFEVIFGFRQNRNCPYCCILFFVWRNALALEALLFPESLQETIKQ